LPEIKIEVGEIELPDLTKCEAEGCEEGADVYALAPLTSEITGVTEWYVTQLCVEHSGILLIPLKKAKERVKALDHFKTRSNKN